MLLPMAYTLFLALELLLMRSVGKCDEAIRPRWVELLRAWLGEVVAVPVVFGWRQPYRAYRVPDNLSTQTVVHGRRGLVFVHGLFCNRGFWSPWLDRLHGSGHAFVAVNLEPVFASIDDYAPKIESAVRLITSLTGLPPLIVCHSMGGLAARSWLKLYAGQKRVCHIVTIGSPHRGTWLARFGYGQNGRQMRIGSAWLRRLNDDMLETDPKLFTCWYSNCDNIVFPVSMATLPGANNRLVRGAAHVQMAFLPEVMDATLARLEACPDACGSARQPV